MNDNTPSAPAQIFLDGKVELRPGDCRDVIRAMPDCSVDSVVCDPPYALVSIVKRFGGPNATPANDNDVYARASSGFMGRTWDTGETAFAETFWREVLRVLKPGGHVVAFSGTRTYHRMAVAIEDAGFEIRDQLAWMYGSGFPKSHDVAKQLDKSAGHWRGMAGAVTIESQVAKGTEYERTDKGEPITPDAIKWQGWGTALKPAWEPICLARKPLIGTVAANVLEHGTGALNIDATRIGDSGGTATVAGDQRNTTVHAFGDGLGAQGGYIAQLDKGRWPANIVHDGSDEVLAGFPETAKGTQGVRDPNGSMGYHGGASGLPDVVSGHSDNGGSAARFFYTAKADKQDRFGSRHPTVKPVDLCQWLVRLVTPKGGLVLDPFAGSGTTGEAAWREGMRCILIERETEYQADIADRLTYADKGPMTRATKIASKRKAPEGALPLFANDNHDDAVAA